MRAASAQDRRWLDAAVRLARPHLGTTADNPTVGALIVDEESQEILGGAVTPRGGRPHAEIQALSEVRGGARGRTLYVTLEPCCHRERTPPCTEAVIQAGIRRVVIGMRDPDQAASGKGISRLRQAGIDVLLAEHPPSRLLHEGHVARKTAGRPFVTATLAISRDDMIGLRDRPKTRPVTCAAAQRWLQMERALSDAVMVGGRTAQIDDPQLTVALKGLETRTHTRVILAGSSPLDPGLQLIAAVSGYPTVILVAAGRRLDVPLQAEVVEVEGRNGRPDLRRSLSALSDRGIGRLLVEGGARLTEALIVAEAIDRFHLVTTPAEIGRKGVPATILGGIGGRLRAAGFAEVDRRAFDPDILQTFEREL